MTVCARACLDRRNRASRRGHNDRLEALNGGAIYMGHSQDMQRGVLSIVIGRVGVEVVGVIQATEMPVHVVIE